MKKVCISGYFNPLHKGHIEYMKLARELGDHLTVIVNNDHQRKLKGSKEFQDEEERCLIVGSLDFVDEVVLSIDLDTSVCKTLEMVKPDIFANGGDRTNKEIPEAVICGQHNIEIIDGLGEKIQSSSDLLKDADERPWGSYEVLYEDSTCKVKRIRVKPNSRLSLQSHEHRSELWYCVSGKLTVHKGTWTGDISTVTLRPEMYAKIKQGELHRAENNTEEESVFIEIQTGTYFGEDDITRYEDDYGRK